MMRPSVQGVNPPVCCTPGCYCYICKRQLCGFPQCAASWMTYARDSFVNSQGGLLSSRGGGGGGPRHIGTSLTVSMEKVSTTGLKRFCVRAVVQRDFKGNAFQRHLLINTNKQN